LGLMFAGDCVKGLSLFFLGGFGTGVDLFVGKDGYFWWFRYLKGILVFLCFLLFFFGGGMTEM